MSGLAGVLRLDGSTADPADVAVMTGLMAHRGPDGVDHWHAGPVALGHLLLSTSGTEGPHERQPLTHPDGPICLTFDGRIDNRADVLAALGPDRGLLRGPGDAELVLQAYRRWGTACLPRLVGDFALALWDGRRAELVCARDALGKRPFYYHHGDAAFRWASEPQAVLADPGIPRRPDVQMVGEHLAAAPASLTRTLVSDLRRLAPAHVLVLSRGRLEIRRFWDWDPHRTVHHADDAGYVEEFLDLFTTAVAARIPDHGPVAAELSGGIDSSAVVAVAATHLDADARSDRLELYSLVFPGRPCDESEHIRAVAGLHGRRTHDFTPEPWGARHFEDQIRRHLDLPEPPNQAMHRAHLLDARTRGCRVVLTGHGGDEWFTGSPYRIADALARLRPGTLRAELDLAATDRRLWPSGAVRQLARFGVLPLLPAPARRLARRRVGRPLLPDWLTPAFRAETGLDERLRTTVPGRPRVAAADVAASLTDGWIVHVAETAERSLAALGLEGRSPFDDRRVVEFALAVPESVRRRGPTTKWVVRRAMRGRLPDSVRGRTDKPGFSHVFHDELEAQGGRDLFVDLAVEDLGWVDGDRLRASYDAFRTAHRRGVGHPDTWALWTTLSTDRWLRGMVPAFRQPG